MIPASVKLLKRGGCMSQVTPTKTVRALDKLELVYLVRKFEKEGWIHEGFVKERVYNGMEWRCYMKKEYKRSQ